MCAMRKNREMCMTLTRKNSRNFGEICGISGEIKKRNLRFVGTKLCQTPREHASSGGAATESMDEEKREERSDDVVERPGRWFDERHPVCDFWRNEFGRAGASASISGTATESLNKEKRKERSNGVVEWLASSLGEWHSVCDLWLLPHLHGSSVLVDKNDVIERIEQRRGNGGGDA